jgi:hypothetical protein
MHSTGTAYTKRTQDKPQDTQPSYRDAGCTTSRQAKNSAHQLTGDRGVSPTLAAPNSQLL